MDAPHETLCPNCLKALTPWPPRHEGYRGVAPLSPPEVAGAGDRFTCQTALCNRYGLVVRVRAHATARAG